MFYYSLGQLAFATASTLTYSNALFMTALAIPILGEKVGVVRWGAVLIGFAGVVMVMGPGRDTFSLVALAPIGAAFFYALTGVTARLVDEDVPSPLLNLYSAFFAALGSVGLVFFLGGFSPLKSASDLAWIAAMGGLGGAAVLCLIVAYRMPE
jgi:drug/metabolite transporter (DMT)-like permease